MKNSDHGFGLIELTVSLALSLVVSGAALALLASGTGSAAIEPDLIDLQQRARAGADALIRDLTMAGAGVNLGPGSGPLRRHLAPIVPRRMGLASPDPPTLARRDAIAIAYVPNTSAQTVLRDPMSGSTPDLRVQPSPNCAALNALCGFQTGSSVLVLDASGEFDFFTITQVILDTGRLRSWRSAGAAHSYPAGSVVSEAEWHTYYLDLPNRQLRHFDGYLTDIPVVDDVVGLEFSYFGDPQPPAEPQPPTGLSSCLYDAAGSLIPGMVTLSAAGGSLAPLSPSVLTDGPWCGSGDNRFDVDLLRIRKIEVSLQLKLRNTALHRRSSDYTLRFAVVPRNMGWER